MYNTSIHSFHLLLASSTRRACAYASSLISFALFKVYHYLFLVTSGSIMRCLRTLTSTMIYFGTPFLFSLPHLRLSPCFAFVFRLVSLALTEASFRDFLFPFMHLDSHMIHVLPLCSKLPLLLFLVAILACFIPSDT